MARNEHNNEAKFALTLKGKAKNIGMGREFTCSKRDMERAKNNYYASKVRYEQAKVNVDYCKEDYERINGFKHPIKKRRARRRLKVAKKRVKLAKMDRKEAKSRKKKYVKEYKEVAKNVKEKYNKYRNNRRDRQKEEFKEFLDNTLPSAEDRNNFKEWLKKKASEPFQKKQNNQKIPDQSKNHEKENDNDQEIA